MINFSIKELNAFAVIGQEVELTNYQKKNIQRGSRRFIVVHSRVHYGNDA